MKRTFLPMLAIVIAFSLSAFTTGESKASANHAVYYWFNGSGTYLGHFSADPSGCNGGSTLCAKGYLSVDDPDHPAQPGIGADRTVNKTT